MIKNKFIIKSSLEVHNGLINDVLLTTPKDIVSIMKRILTHMMEIIEFKGISFIVLIILGKVVSLVKIVFFDTTKGEKINR